MVNLLRQGTFTLTCLLWLEGLDLSPSLWLTSEKVESSQANTCQQSQQFPTMHTGTQGRAQLLRIHLQLSSNTVTYYSPQNKRQQLLPPQHTKSLTITWCSERVPAHFPLLFFLFKRMMPLQQRSLLCSNNIPHNCTGFQPSNLSTKDQRIASRLSQKRTIVLSTLYTTGAPIELCIMGMNLDLGLCEFLLYKGRSLKGI